MTHTLIFKVVIEIPEEQDYDSLAQFSSLAMEKLDEATNKIMKETEIEFLHFPPIDLELL